MFDPLKLVAGDRLLDDSGNVILDASGNVMLSDGAGDDCCCDNVSPDDCWMCGTNPTPLRISADVADVVVCGCLPASIYYNSGNPVWIKFIGDPNGSYEMDQQNDPLACANCFWTKTIPGMTFEAHGNDSCTSKLAEGTVSVTLRCASPNHFYCDVGTDWALVISGWAVWSTYSYAYGELFRAEYAWACTFGDSRDNQYVACPGDACNAGRDGTITLYV